MTGGGRTGPLPRDAKTSGSLSVCHGHVSPVPLARHRVGCAQGSHRTFARKEANGAGQHPFRAATNTSAVCFHHPPGTWLLPRFMKESEGTERVTIALDDTEEGPF